MVSELGKARDDVSQLVGLQVTLQLFNGLLLHRSPLQPIASITLKLQPYNSASQAVEPPTNLQTDVPLATMAGCQVGPAGC